MKRQELDNPISNTRVTTFGDEKLDIDKEYSIDNFKKYLYDPDRFQDLIKVSYEGGLSDVKLRWSCWRACLGLFPVGPEEKIPEALKKSRDYYYQEFDRLTNIRGGNQKEVVDDPLSKNSNNPWNSFFEDNELKTTIKQDVDRTYQDKDFFLSKKIKDLLLNVLFVWSKLNPTVSYRQGMNEIAGLLTYVCFMENTTNVSDKSQFTESFINLNDEKHSEADIFTVFNKIMELGQKDMFNPNPINPSSVKNQYKRLDRIFGSSMGEATRPKSALIARSGNIQENLLETIDEQLYTHMKKIGVEPQVYLLRWIRCMLAREYRMSDAIIVWDALFAFFYQNRAEAKTLEMIDFMSLGMLQFVRHDLLMKDDSSLCYARLMKYPPVENIASIISLALKCKASLLNQSSDLKNFQKQDFLNRSTTPSKMTELKADNHYNEPMQVNTPSNGQKKGDAVLLFPPGFFQKAGTPSSTTGSTISSNSPLPMNPGFQRIDSSGPNKPNSLGKLDSNEKSIEDSNWVVYNKIQDVLELLRKESQTRSSSNLDTAIQDLHKANEILFENTANIKKNDRSKPNLFGRSNESKPNGIQSFAPNTAQSAKEESGDPDPLSHMKSGIILKK
jgi:TBC1 domain family protein 5